MSHPEPERKIETGELPAGEPDDERTPSTITVIDTQSFHRPLTPPPKPKPSGDDSSVVSASSSSSARYEVRKVLGSGGFGTVSLAWDSTLQREVAIKRPTAHLTAELKQTFLAEARLAAKVKHPGIVVVHDVGVDQSGDPFVVYEYLAGANLKQRMSKEPYPLRTALELTLALAEALGAAHQQGLTHRDLKPANVLIDEQGKPHIADFGLATEHEEQADLRGQIAGTNRYMSPEQVRGESHHLDGRTDLWSLGVIMYELLTGQTPFPGKQEQVFEQILNREPRPPRQWLNQIPKRVEAVTLKLLSKHVAARYSSASDLADELRACLEDCETQRSAEGDGAVPATARRIRHSAPLYLVAAGLLLTVVVLGALMFGGNFAPNSMRPGSPAITPPSDADFRVDAWIPLLQQEPLGLVFDRDDRKVYHQGELWLRSEYQALLQLGTTAAKDYSFRATLQPVDWEGEAGLFVGYQRSTTKADVDVVVLIGLTQGIQDKIVLQPYLLELERQGNQLPRLLEPVPLPTTSVPKPADGLIRLQIDVRQGKLAAVLINNRPVQLAFQSDVIDISVAGKFGVYVSNSTCDFTTSEIRITKEGR